jgi:hypothetical protein
MRELRTAHFVHAPGLRLLRVNAEKPRAWDPEKTMPSDTLGAEGTHEDLVSELQRMISETTGGAEFLAPAPEERAVAVLVATLSAALSRDWATAKDRKRAALLTRPDAYEGIVRGMGLETYFQAIRKLVEVRLDEPEHRPLRVPWPLCAGRPLPAPRTVALLRERGEGHRRYLTFIGPCLREF